MTTKSRLGRLLLVSAFLTFLVITTIDGYPLRELGPWLRYIPDDVDSSETIAVTAKSFPTPFPLWVWNKCVGEEIDTKTTTTNEHNTVTSSPPEFQINLKKKNSEIISVLMGLRRAMSNNYGNGVGERRLHDNNAF